MTAWLPFTARYGLQENAVGSGDKHWAGRHVPHDVRLDERRRCRCSGSFQRTTPQCCQAMTAEDLRCDHCREHCWGVRNSPAGQVRVMLSLVADDIAKSPRSPGR
jgi:hypothetical protein